MSDTRTNPSLASDFVVTETAIDVLARIDNNDEVTFWRRKAGNDPSTATIEDFQTGESWVLVTGDTLSAAVDVGEPTTSCRIVLTAFASDDRDRPIQITRVASETTPSYSWDRAEPDPDPDSPSYISPAYDVRDATMATTVSVYFGRRKATLNIALTFLHDLPPDAPAPVDPILIATEPQPVPNPIGSDFLLAAPGQSTHVLGTPGPLARLGAFLDRNRRFVGRLGRIDVALTQLIRSRGPQR